MKKGNVTLVNCQKIWDGYFENLSVPTKMQVQGQTVLCDYEDAGRLNMEDFFSGRKIWKVNKGMLHVIMHGKSGKTMVLFKITPDNSGFVLPEGCPELMFHNVEVLSVGKTEVCYLPEYLSRQMYRECEKIRSWQSGQYMKVFSKLLEMISDLSFLSLYERLQKEIYEYCGQHQTDIVRMTHEQLACDLGTSREVISRLLKKMEAEQLIKIERKSIRVLKREENEKRTARMVG